LINNEKVKIRLEKVIKTSTILKKSLKKKKLKTQYFKNNTKQKIASINNKFVNRTFEFRYYIIEEMDKKEDNITMIENEFSTDIDIFNRKSSMNNETDDSIGLFLSNFDPDFLTNPFSGNSTLPVFESNDLERTLNGYNSNSEMHTSINMLRNLDINDTPFSNLSNQFTNLPTTDGYSMDNYMFNQNNTVSAGSSASNISNVLSETQFNYSIINEFSSNLNEQPLNHNLNTMDGDETQYISSSNLSNQCNNLPTINGYLMNCNQSLENDCVFNQNETVSAPSSVSNKPNMYSMPQGSFIDNEFNYSNRNLTNSSSDLLSPNMTGNLSVNENSFSSYLSDSASTSNSCLLDSNQSSESNMSPIRQSLSMPASTINIYNATNDHRNFSDIELVSVRNNANCFAINSKKSLKRCSKKKSKSIKKEKQYKTAKTQLKYDLLKQVDEIKIENEESRKINAKLKKELNYFKNLLQKPFASRLQQ
jgi:hypothetical protein